MTQKSAADKNKEFLPPLDFSSIVYPFYAQALLKLGLIDNPAKAKTEQNLELARRLIDLLDLLKERTNGNLKPGEEKFIQTCLQQLKAGYLEKSKIVNF
jgi:ABC-type hemin transport system ATPase subunit